VGSESLTWSTIGEVDGLSIAPVTENAIGGAGVQLWAKDLTYDAGTRPGIGATIGAVEKQPVQVCETSKFTAARGASFASTIGPLS
jgi:hypothetical protein